MDSFLQLDLIHWPFLTSRESWKHECHLQQALADLLYTVALLRVSSRGHHPVTALLSTLLHAYYGSHEKMIMTRFLTHQKL